MKVAYCTIASANYLPRVRVLQESLLRFHPDAYLHVLLSETPDTCKKLSAETGYRFITPVEVCDRWLHMAFYYEIIEFNTALKPFLVDRLLNDGYDAVVYLDPDIEIFNELSDIENLFDEYDLILTPHISSPMPLDGLKPTADAIVKAGQFNLGFIGITGSEEVRGALQWWMEICTEHCLFDNEKGYFVDQFWAGIFPSFIQKFYCLRDPAYNMAYWNVFQRPLMKESQHWVTTSGPLKFFHFSGLDNSDLSRVSRYQSRMLAAPDSSLYELLSSYREKIASNDWSRYAMHPYSFGLFGNGQAIPQAQRRIFLGLRSDERNQIGDPFAKPEAFGDKRIVDCPDLQIGLINEATFSLDWPHGVGWNIFNFTISGDALSTSEIFNSAFATPARYVQEIYSRLCNFHEPSILTPKLVLNPLFEFDRFSLPLVLAVLGQASSSQVAAVFVDENDLPAAYYFPAWISPEESHFLALLSCVSGPLDAEILQRLFFSEVELVRVPRLYLNAAGHNDFAYEQNKEIYQWVTRNAIRVLSHRLQDRCLTGGDKELSRRQRDLIPFIALMPHHAGDILFLSLSFKNIVSYVSGVVVNKVYRDIVLDNAPLLKVYTLDIPVINRGDEPRRGKITPEHVYFDKYKDRLTEDVFYLYLRPSRDYNATIFHLMDHFAFALGRHFWRGKDLLFNSKAPPPLHKPLIPPKPIKILLHFDGGWPLKVYPTKLQDDLINRLQSIGYEVTVLGAHGDSHASCRVVTFESYSQFVDLLRCHHLLVGMDSFPTHYGAHILGVPTICLFASTRPENSNAAEASNYTFMEKGLRCRPCYGIVKCPKYGGEDCRNFVEPEAIVRKIQDMLQTADAHHTSQMPNASTLERAEMEIGAKWSRPRGYAKTVRIRMIHSPTAILVLGLVLPYIRYIEGLYKEFTAAVKKDGFYLAVRRSIRFLVRAISRRRAIGN